MNELFSIAGKVAVITGAGGVLGGNIAQHFVQQGAKVVAIDIRQEQLDNRGIDRCGNLSAGRIKGVG